MEKNPVPHPVRYRDVEKKMSRPAFNKHFQKIVGDVYLHKDVATDPDAVTNALLLRCPAGVLRGFSALRNMGYTINHDDWTPMISVPRHHRHVHPASGQILRLVEKNIVFISGRRSVTSTQAIVDVLSRADSWGRWRDGTRMEEQVALIDHLARQDPKLLTRLNADPRTVAVADWAHPLAESRPESIVRVRLHQAGFTGWKPQVKVRGREKFYYVDLGDPVLQVGVEYQGAHHFDRDARARDAQRANDLSWAGWTIIETTSVILSSEVEWQKLLKQVGEELVLARQQRNRRLP